MADKKVSDLPSLNGADVDPADLLYIVDSSAGAAGSKKITVGQYQLAPVSGGTANTVVYLNGSKVESSSSALTFDGTNLGIGTSSPGVRVDASGQVRALEAGTGSGDGGLIGSTASADGNAGVLFQTNSASRWNLTTAGTAGANLRVYNYALGSTVATFNSSGNLGLGVTPSAWSLGKAFELGGVGSFIFGGGPTQNIVGTNSYYNSGWKYASTGLSTQYEQSAGAHYWYNAPSGTAGNAISFTQAMTLTADTKLLVGVTAPIFPTANRASVEVNGASQALLGFGVGGTGAGYVLHDGTDMEIVQSRNGYMRFLTNAAERARITSGGDLLVGDTLQPTSADNRVAIVGTRGIDCKNTGGATAPNITAWNNATTGDNIFISFRTETTDTQRGSITYNRGAGQVAYNITSDARLKENIADADDAGSKVDALQVRKFDWKETGNHVDYGFVAQELEPIVPHAVSKPDAEDEMWSVDYSKLVPMLIKEIQSLRARVAALEAK